MRTKAEECRDCGYKTTDKMMRWKNDNKIRNTV